MGIMDPMRMPMDNVVGPARSEDWGLNHQTIGWHLHFCLWPRECFLTGQRIWFKTCYKGSRTITGPGEPVFIDHYVDRYEFLIWQLKKNA